ncbi:MAG: ribosomal protein S18-alanine N-acetyltransferase [Oscillospiraceae bacterium]|jgi:ribosomal-protein-alanine N-acetyltransferase|nr:ribosomal protein S18-alanine N-acetyltransferase [Oscillospiraceae bacterium]
MKLESQKMEASHLEHVLKIEAECGKETWSKANILSELQKENSICLVAINPDSDAVLGHIFAYSVLDEAYINKVAVAKGSRGLGIGKFLVKIVLDKAVNLGLESVMLEVRQSNLAAISLYLGCGFCEVGRRTGFYKNPHEDAILMTFSTTNSSGKLSAK